MVLTGPVDDDLLLTVVKYIHTRSGSVADLFPQIVILLYPRFYSFTWPYMPYTSILPVSYSALRLARRARKNCLTPPSQTITRNTNRPGGAEEHEPHWTGASQRRTDSIGGRSSGGSLFPDFAIHGATGRCRCQSRRVPGAGLMDQQLSWT